MARKMRVNVKHDGKDYPKGSVCPDDLVKKFAKAGLLEGSPEEPSVLAKHEDEKKEVAEAPKKVDSSSKKEK